MLLRGACEAPGPGRRGVVVNTSSDATQSRRGPKVAGGPNPKSAKKGTRPGAARGRARRRGPRRRPQRSAGAARRRRAHPHPSAPIKPSSQGQKQEPTAPRKEGPTNGLLPPKLKEDETTDGPTHGCNLSEKKGKPTEGHPLPPGRAPAASSAAAASSWPA